MSFLRRFVCLYVKQHLDAQAVHDRKRLNKRPDTDDDRADPIDSISRLSDDPTLAFDIISTIQGMLNAQNAWTYRRQSEIAFQRSRAAMKAALLLYDAGERVSGASIARLLGWPTSVGVAALKAVREELKLELYEAG